MYSNRKIYLCGTFSKYIQVNASSETLMISQIDCSSTSVYNVTLTLNNHLGYTIFWTKKTACGEFSLKFDDTQLSVC